MDVGNGVRPVAVNVGVRDLEEAIRFYEAAFGVHFEVSEADGRPTHARLQFGEGDSVFLLNMRVRAADDPHRHHISAFGFVVDEIDTVHERAVARRCERAFSVQWTGRAFPATRGSRTRVGIRSSSGSGDVLEPARRCARCVAQLHKNDVDPYTLEATSG